MSLEEACAQLVKDAEEESDPFMRELLMATAAGAMAGQAWKESKAKPSNEKLTDAGTKRP